MPMINVEELIKEYKVKGREKGVKRAVDNISFSIDRGEIVGYIGPNGAGKSTTIKMLTGILVPTGGKIEVNGIVPYKNRIKNAKNIGVVFGQRTQLWWDLPVLDSYTLLRHIYEIPKQTFNNNLKTFRQVLGLDEFLSTPVRQLSLGQRMRADIAASLLHNPEILFLDEPTIGLDAVSKENMRQFIRLANRERNITVILTTHDMSDIEELCSRIMIIDNGRTIYDGSLESIRARFSRERILVVDFANAAIALPHNTVLKKEDGLKKWIAFNRDEFSASKVISMLSEKNEIVDISIIDESIESIIQKLYLNNFKGG